MAADGIDAVKRTPTAEYSRCRNRKQKLQECTVCRDICPKGAIVYDNPKGAIVQGEQMKRNPELCIGCHLCHGICPTGCISAQRSLIKGSDAADDDTLMICCRRGSTDSVGINVPCIASLPWEFYAYLSCKGPISILATDCSLCAFGAAEHILAIHRRLQLFWGEDDYNKKILSHTEAPPVAYSRREAFGFLARKVKRPVDILLPQEIEEVHPNLYRNLLLSVLDSQRMHGWLTWEIGPSCRGCGLCVKICPHQAIQITDEDGRRGFFHDLLRCVGCQICKIVCLEKCIGEQIVHKASKADPLVLRTYIQ
jgi:formate hydrogenlyase subunit 6/NADH:ubiquinone oxidoreductase subunit I